MAITHLVFDLDDTLYAQDNGLWGVLGERISLYMIERLGLPAAEVPTRREHYFRTYGTSLNGLRRDFQIDPADFLHFVHDVPLANYIQPDTVLDAMLTGLPLHKSIFTNADAPHARRVLAQLGIAHHFNPIVDIVALNFVNKPQAAAYQVLLDALGVSPEQCVFVEDSLRNLLPARALGMKTIWINPQTAPAEADFVVRHVHEVGGVLHGLL